MLRFAEEIMLLVLDDKGGKFADVPMLSGSAMRLSAGF